MKSSKKENPSNKETLPTTPEQPASLTLGSYAWSIISGQYQSTLKQEKHVLADKDPEYLHHMRVGTRRLRTALQVFDVAVQLPKAASESAVAAIAKILGQLRDLDVQIADLQDNYRPQLPKAEQKRLDTVIAALRQQRLKRFADVEETLTRSHYREFKQAYKTWLKKPRYKAIASLPLLPLLPDLLSPLLAALLLHSGWLVPAHDSSEAANELLHNLRKSCKHARYEAEFFAPFYRGNSVFTAWMEDMKAIQSKLGTVHDSYVLLDILKAHLPRQSKLPTLKTLIQSAQTDALADWESIRQKYLSPQFRQQLHHMLLNSKTPIPDQQLVGLELSGQKHKMSSRDEESSSRETNLMLEKEIAAPG